MRLERKWSRLVIVLLGATLPLVFMPWLLEDTFAGASPVWGLLCMAGAVVLIVIQGIVFSKKLRCPNCGKTVAPPQWKPGERYTCARCGKPFIYDDEPEESSHE